jgi:hypothetical protein
MTRDEFVALPASLALGLVYDATPSLASIPAPRAPLPPKFDSKVSRKGGQYCWASEMLLADLKYWHDKNAAGATDGSQYAEKNAKQAKALSYWVAYRQVCPTDAWSGERDRVKVRAQTPSRDPELHDWKRTGEAAPAQGGGYSDADYGSKEDPDPLPF